MITIYTLFEARLKAAGFDLSTNWGRVPFINKLSGIHLFSLAEKEYACQHRQYGELQRIYAQTARDLPHLQALEEKARVDAGLSKREDFISRLMTAEGDNTPFGVKLTEALKNG